MAAISSWKNQEIHVETISAVFIILLFSIFILANFASGFIWPLYLAAAGIGFFVSLSYPASGIYAIVALTFIFERFFTLQPLMLSDVAYKLYPIDILLGGVIAGLIIQLVSRQVSFSWLKRDLWIMLFIMLTLILFIASFFEPTAQFELSFSSFKNYGIYSLLYFIIAILMSDRQRFDRLMKFGFWSAVALIFFILYGIAGGGGLWTEYTPLSTEGVRILAFTHAFYLSLAALFTLAFLFGRLQRENETHLVPLAGIWAIGIVGSMMRHLWIGLAAALAALLWLLSKEARQGFIQLMLKGAAGAIMISLVMGYLSFIFPSTEMAKTYRSIAGVLYTRGASFMNYSGDDSFTWRGAAWREGFNEFLKHPAQGIGFGKKIFIYDEKNRDFVEVRNIHNSLLVILVQMGIIGAAVFLSAVYATLKPLAKKASQDWKTIAITTSLVFYLIVCLFQPYLEANLLGIFFWILLGLARAQKIKSSGDLLIFSRSDKA